MNLYFSVSVMGLYRLISAAFWPWLWLVSLYQMRLYSEPVSFSMETLQKKVALSPSGTVNTAGEMVTIWERRKQGADMVTAGTALRNNIPVWDPGMQAQSMPSLWDMGRYISPCLSRSKCVPAGWRGTLRGSNCTVKWFQQTKLCSGLPKTNTEHLYQGKQSLAVVFFFNSCCLSHALSS